MTTRIRHVLFVTDAFDPEIGGVERVCSELARALVAQGVRVTVLARAMEGAPAHERIIPGLTVRRFPQAPHVTPWIWATHIAAAGRLTAAVLADDPPDVAHLHLSLSAQGPLSAIGRAVPVLCGFYGRWDREFDAELSDQDSDFGPVHRWYFHAQNAARRAMQRRMLGSARRVVVLSEFSRREALSLAPWVGPRVTRIPGGVDTARFRLTPHPKRAAKGPVILTVRRLVRRMGIDQLIDAASLLVEEFPGLRLVVAGRGPEEAALRARTERLGLGARIEFPGFVEESRLPDLYRSADVVAIPTRSQENFGLPVLEAASCGCEVVATAVGSLPEVMAAAGSPYLSAHNTPAALAEAMAAALRRRNEPDRRRAREQAAAQIAETHAWPVIARAYLDLYEELGGCASR